jgi:uncharacterized peroxidase-related enzyme
MKMNRLKLHDVSSAPEGSKPLLEGVQKRFGRVPNFFGLMANSPGVLKGYLDLQTDLASTGLPARLRELIAVYAAAWNECDYCFAAHTAAAKKYNYTDEQLEAMLRGDPGDDVKLDAALHFVRRLLETHGGVSEGDIATVRAAGYDDAGIAALIAATAAQFFSNFLNRAMDTEVDFPKPPIQRAAVHNSGK